MFLFIRILQKKSKAKTMQREEMEEDENEEEETPSPPTKSSQNRNPFAEKTMEHRKLQHSPKIMSEYKQIEVKEKDSLTFAH